MLKLTTDGFTIVSVAAGLRASWLWLRSGRPSYALVEPDQPAYSDEVLPENSVPGWDEAMPEETLAEPPLNSQAALWTAATIAAQVIAATLAWFG